MNSWFQTRAAKRLAVVVGLTSAAFILADIYLAFTNRNARLPADLRSWTFSNVLDLAVNVAVPLIGVLLATRRPENPIGWIFLVAGLGLALENPSQDYAVHALLVDPGSLPFGLLFGWLENWVWPIPIFMLCFLFLLFPDGHLPWPPRRWLARAAAGALILLLIASIIAATVGWSQPFAVQSQSIGLAPVLEVLTTVIFYVAFTVFPIALIGAFLSMVFRYRRAGAEERLQLKWFVTAAGFVAATFAISIPTGNLLPALFNVLSSLALLFLYVAIAISILRYRLYEINVVIGRAVVLAALIVFITVVYIGVVIGVGASVGNTRSPLLSAVAAAVVAVAFQPVRERARRLANRVVYGKRATPYELLSGFTERAAGTLSTEDVLPRLVRVLAEGIGANEARVWLAVGNELRLAAAWPADGQVTSLPCEGPDRLPAFPQPERAFPVQHAGQLLGAISVVTPPNDPLGPDRQRLVEDVAAQTSLVLRNVRLIEELRESRRRIVTAQDERAKALERNIHDGAQQQLVALGIKLRLLGQMTERDPAKAKALAEQLQAESSEALENLRDLARGIYPPLLASEGLAAALQSQVRKSPLPVSVEASELGRYPQEVESAVYFCCLEALQNVAKYAQANEATVRLANDPESLRFEVQDDGVGFDTSTTGYGTGLQGMADRIEALGGPLQVLSAPSEGTTIRGNVPVHSP